MRLPQRSMRVPRASIDFGIQSLIQSTCCLPFLSFSQSATVDRFRRRLHALFGLSLLLLAQLLPAFGQVVLAAGGLVEIELCSVHGNRAFLAPASGEFVVIDASLSAAEVAERLAAELPPPPDGQDYTSCPCCCAHAAVDALLPTLASVAVLDLPLQQAFPPLYYQAPRLPFAWSPSSPRAPPPTV